MEYRRPFVTFQSRRMPTLHYHARSAVGPGGPVELHVGSRLAHFEILGLLGAGGMGEVYRAMDTKLRREVAIKVLPPQYAEQSDRLARFEQEAVLLASLNHPHVAAIYGVEHVDGVPFLELELVEGPTLADRLISGPIPVPEAIKIAGQIADALEAAHEKGIVHRDLKPANVKLTPDGKVKVLDFGLAKAFGPEQTARLSGATRIGPAAVTEPRHTQAGLVMGTASYMSPEQAEGKPVDKRTDVWSFGVLLYEMLTGKRLFDGKSDAHVLVHVMEQEPDWSKLPPLPNGVQALMERCLQKDPAQRLRDIGDVRIMLQASLTHPIQARESGARRAAGSRPWLWPAVAAAAIVMAAIIGVLAWPRSPAVVADAVRFDINRAEGQSSPYITISPDGRLLALIVSRPDGAQQIWVRSMATQEARPLESTLGAQGVSFWSADSRYIVFSSLNKLRRVDATGGPSQLLGDVQPVSGGGFSTPDNRIVYSDITLGAMQVPAAGGAQTPFSVSAGQDNKGVITPSPLPGGNLVFCRCLGSGERGIYLATPGTGQPRKILPDQSIVQYAPSPDPDRGYVLFVRGGAGPGDSGTLMAQAIQPRQLRLIGDPIAIAEKVRGFSASETGVLVYSNDATVVPSTIPGILQGQLTWFDREGHVVSTVGDPSIYRIAVLSPDEQFAALERADPATQNLDIYLFEFARGVSNRFTFDAARDVSPVWSPDGASVIFTRMKDSVGEWYRRAANLAGDEELLFRAPGLGVPSSISPNGRFLLFTGPLPGPADIGVVDISKVAEAREAIPLVTSDFNEANARFSPNGRWFAYASNESGTYEIYVRPFNPDAPPGAPLSTGGRVMVSKGGASVVGAIWRADGKELFYVGADRSVMSVPIETEPTFKVAGPPQALFKLPTNTNTTFFDVSRDGQRFLVPVAVTGGLGPPPFKVVLNWTSTLK
jgi:eukaryotic-like serine/threonine-protein kinase